MILGYVLVTLAGMVICTLGDHLHATQGVLVYRVPFLWDQAIWVPPEFAAASLAAVLGARTFVKKVVRPDARRIAIDGVGFFAAYAYTSFAPFDRPGVTLLVLVVAWAVRVIAERRSAGLVAWCVVLAICGCSGEGSLASTGAFHYLHPDVFNVPRWLPGIYLHAGLVSGELAALLTKERP